MKQSNKPSTIRKLPFFFSPLFFGVFGSASAILTFVYVYYPAGIQVPLIVDGIILFLAVLDFLLCPPPSQIRLERTLPYPLAVDQPNDIAIEIANLTGSAVSLIVKDDVPRPCRCEPVRIVTTASPGSGNRASYKITPLERGNGEFGDIHFWVRGPLGLIWRRGVSPAAATVKLYPGLAAIREQRLRVWRPIVSDIVRTRWKKGVGTEFDSLREYAVGDDSRLIHWSTSARKGKLVVRQNRMERSQIVFLVLDAGRMMSARVLGKTKLDHGLNAALLLAYSALELGDKVGVMAVAQDILCFLPPASYSRQFGRILDATYALKPTMEEPRFHLALATVAARLRRRALVIVFTDLIDERASEGLLRYSVGLLPRHLPLVVAMSDTEVIDLADATPRTEQDLYRQGVAAGMLERRERLMARLSSLSVLVIDTPPEKISVDVLDQYLEIKARNLL